MWLKRLNFYINTDNVTCIRTVEFTLFINYCNGIETKFHYPSEEAAKEDLKLMMEEIEQSKE